MLLEAEMLPTISRTASPYEADVRLNSLRFVRSVTVPNFKRLIGTVMNQTMEFRSLAINTPSAQLKTAIAAILCADLNLSKIEKRCSAHRI